LAILEEFMDNGEFRPFEIPFNHLSFGDETSETIYGALRSISF